MGSDSRHWRCVVCHGLGLGSTVAKVWPSVGSTWSWTLALLLGWLSHVGPKPSEWIFCVLSSELDLLLGKTYLIFSQHCNSYQGLLNVGITLALFDLYWAECDCKLSHFLSLGLGFFTNGGKGGLESIWDLLWQKANVPSSPACPLSLFSFPCAEAAISSNLLQQDTLHTVVHHMLKM